MMQHTVIAMQNICIAPDVQENIVINAMIVRTPDANIIKSKEHTYVLNSGGDVINNQLVDSRVVNNCNEYVKVVIAASRGRKTSKTVIRKENILTIAKELKQLMQ